MLRLIWVAWRAFSRHVNWPSKRIDSNMKPHCLYSFLICRIEDRRVLCLAFWICSTVIKFICLDLDRKNRIPLIVITSPTSWMDRYRSSIAEGTCVKDARAWIDLDLVVFPLRHCRLFPKMSSAAMMSISRMGFFLIHICWRFFWNDCNLVHR